MSSPSSATGLVLAGGSGRRFHGADKGLFQFEGRALFQHVAAALAPHVSRVLISANRNVNAYAKAGHTVLTDGYAERLGPLAGIAAGIKACTDPTLIIAPCDMPLLPPATLGALLQTRIDNDADVALAQVAGNDLPVVAAIATRIAPSLEPFIATGGRTVREWYAQHQYIVLPVEARPELFLNVNTPTDLRTLERYAK